jgi:glucosamine-phosphate N-acetyltransferase
MKEIEIQEMSYDDLLERFESFKRSLEPLAQTSGLNKALAETIYFNRTYAGIRTFIAVLEDEIVGTASIFVEYKYIHNGGVVGHIEDVSVAEDYQDAGVGQMLINALIHVAKAAGCYKVILDCNGKTAGFYKKLGFHEHEICMRKDISF